MENPKYWRNRLFNYSLSGYLDSSGHAEGSLPRNVRDFVEQQPFGAAVSEGLLVTPLLSTVIEKTQVE